jgi:two-component system sensor histidine kinase PilS (NtrC family)
MSIDQPVSRVAQAIAFNIIGILIVGLLSARLSERRRIGEELRYTEESFADLHILHERIVDSIGSGLMTTDLEGRIFAFNRAAERISGLDAGKVIGMSIFSIFDDTGRESIENALSGFR